MALASAIASRSVVERRSRSAPGRRPPRWKISMSGVTSVTSAGCRKRPPRCSPPHDRRAGRARGLEHAQSRARSWRSEISGPRSGSSIPGPIVTCSQRRGDARDRRRRRSRALDQQPRARRAALAGVLDQRVDDRGDRLVEVGVGEDDVRGLAAELELERRQAARARLGDLRAGGGASRRTSRGRRPGARRARRRSRRRRWRPGSSRAARPPPRRTRRSAAA